MILISRGDTTGYERTQWNLWQKATLTDAWLCASFDTYEELVECVARHICRFSQLGQLIIKPWNDGLFFAEKIPVDGAELIDRVEGKRLFTEALTYG